MLEQQLRRLAELGIQLVPALEITTHFVFERDGFVALVERKDDGFGNIGAPGMLAGKGGFAALVWRGGDARFVGRGFDEPATPEQVASIRKFDRDLREALG